MSHGFELKPAVAGIDADTPAVLLAARQAAGVINQAVVVLGMLALLVASLVILTYSVVSRYLLQRPRTGRTRRRCFCLVGRHLHLRRLCAVLRGHIGIEAMAGLLPPSVNRLRLALVDLMCTCLLRLLRLEILDAVRTRPGSTARSDLDVLGAAAVDPLRPDGARHDAAEPAAAVQLTARISAPRKTTPRRLRVSA